LRTEGAAFPIRSRTPRPAAPLAIALAGLGALTGCYQDVSGQPRTKPLRGSRLFADGGASRPLVPGTVARGHLEADDLFYTGLVNGFASPVFPWEPTRADLERGRDRFAIFCSPCHDRTGSGNGMAVQRGFLRPPNYSEERLRKAPPGHFFIVMTQGIGGMPDYAEQVPPADRWRIAAWIRALQFGRNVPIAEVPEAERKALTEER
jgi:mono/diheme cytochrome c family protein